MATSKTVRKIVKKWQLPRKLENLMFDGWGLKNIEVRGSNVELELYPPS